MKSYSQYNQDVILNELIFKNKLNGVFIDIGAFDGVEKSNTFLYEKELNWSGICVEPIEKRYQQLIQNRECDCIHGVVSDREDDFVTFCEIDGYSEMLSGILDEYDELHKLRIINERCARKKVTYKNYRINQLIKDHNIKTIDLLDIDTEGNELKILKDIDYNLVNINTILVECNYDSTDMKEFMAQQNFHLATNIGADLVFVKNK
jgi:FkbM family methyltransferase